ncbi:MAG: tRNA pseudouridine(38-40) synthase TruA [Quisquiliibacterium sp.]
MMRLALTLAYEGSAFNGWQTQPGGAAAQDVLESALARIAGQPVATVCAGRTDAGVHALAQLVHFDTDAQRPNSAWVRGVNSLLPPGIAVQHCHPVDDAFSARYCATRRAYTYLIYRGAQRHPLYSARAGWCFRALDVPAMARAAQALLGEHDFSAFRSSQCQARSPVRTMHQVQLREQGSLLVIQLQANAFLHHMVRNIVGALVWIGLRRRPEHWIAELLERRDRTLAAPTFAAQGLYLTGVDYPEHYHLPTWPPAKVPLT